MMPMKAIVKEFERTNKNKISLIFGSSGKLYAQIKNGAPYQAFFSADQVKPKILCNENIGLKKSLFTYATGRLALWSSQKNMVTNDFSILSNLNFNKLSLANPRLAPYGYAAKEVLIHLNLLKTTRSKWVQGENISQAYQFVYTANADIGFIALAQIMKNEIISKGSYWLVPENFHSPIYQDAVLIKKSLLGRRFFDFFKTQKVKNILKSYGYSL
ncbi:MAG: molybdate ABC transporter substrate-binding protein [Candidatus Cloacimonadota bacterium]|nr:MAG: molybdate ABC transporter substrate-binding protein [Candidatus Cloacimonadota bacterium]